TRADVGPPSRFLHFEQTGPLDKDCRYRQTSDACDNRGGLSLKAPFSLLEEGLVSQQKPGSPDTDAPDSPAAEHKPTFGDIFGNREAATFLAAFCLSNAGAMLNRVAVTFLVWNNTGSSALAAASFAISFAPYLGLAQ